MEWGIETALSTQLLKRLLIYLFKWTLELQNKTNADKL